MPQNVKFELYYRRRTSHMSMENHLHALENQREELKKRLHRELTRPAADERALRELKREKLVLKDRIEDLRRSQSA